MAGSTRWPCWPGPGPSWSSGSCRQSGWPGCRAGREGGRHEDHPERHCKGGAGRADSCWTRLRRGVPLRLSRGAGALGPRAGSPSDRGSARADRGAEHAYPGAQFPRRTGGCGGPDLGDVGDPRDLLARSREHGRCLQSDRRRQGMAAELVHASRPLPGSEMGLARIHRALRGGNPRAPLRRLARLAVAVRMVSGRIRPVSRCSIGLWWDRGIPRRCLTPDLDLWWRERCHLLSQGDAEEPAARQIDEFLCYPTDSEY